MFTKWNYHHPTAKESATAYSSTPKESKVTLIISYYNGLIGDSRRRISPIRQIVSRSELLTPSEKSVSLA